MDTKVIRPGDGAMADWVWVGDDEEGLGCGAAMATAASHVVRWASVLVTLVIGAASVAITGYGYLEHQRHIVAAGYGGFMLMVVALWLGLVIADNLADYGRAEGRPGLHR